MSLDKRQPGSWDNDAPGGPNVLREVIQKDLGDLSTQDKEAMKRAAGAFIRYTAFGTSVANDPRLTFWLRKSSRSVNRTVFGAGAGAMLALRGRYSLSNWKKLPRLFPQGITSPPNPEALRDRAGFFVRAVAFSTGGVLVGQSIGFALGTWKSSQIIKRDGNYENIERVMRRVQKDIKDGYGKANEGAEDRYGEQGRTLPALQRRKLQGVDQIQRDDPDNSKLARDFEPDVPAQDQKAWNDASFARDTSSNGNDFYGSTTSQSQRSGAAAQSTSPTTARKTRWEELRGARDSRDSAWEKIRQDGARQAWQDNAGLAGSQAATDSGMESRPASEMFSEEARRSEDERKRAQTKERERREYEKMFERESKGMDSISDVPR